MVIPGIQVDLDAVVTNLVYFDVGPVSADTMLSKLADVGVLMIATAPHTIRAVTSLEVNSEDINNTINIIEGIAAGLAGETI